LPAKSAQPLASIPVLYLPDDTSMTASRLVYSTDAGRICPDCGRSIAACVCKKTSARPASNGGVRVSRQTKGRGGKTVTRIEGLPLDDDALMQLGKQLRSTCGSGGTVKDGVIEVQGDHCDKVIEALKQLGYAPKRAGG
jgi:translation initiation factor 1